VPAVLAMRSRNKPVLISFLYLSSRLAMDAGRISSSNFSGKLLANAAAATVRKMPVMSAAVLKKAVASEALATNVFPI
jgi:hypothetical protein